MRWSASAIGVLAAVAVGVAALSGARSSDPRSPAGLPGLPPPFLGVAVVGSGGRTAAVDAYGNVVDLRPGGPAGEPLIQVPARLLAAGTVPPGSVRVARARVGGRSLPLWRADSVAQRYLPGTNVLRTVAHFGTKRRVIIHPAGAPAAAARSYRRWLRGARPLGAGAPWWARAMYRRSLLVLRALTDRRTGAVAAGAREGWAYVWPRDAGAVGLALAAAGYRREARLVARFLLGLDLDSAARFHGDGDPVEGRAAQGDAFGWAAAAARAASLPMAPGRLGGHGGSWRDRADYQEKAPGDYLGNALAVGRARTLGAFLTPSGLVRIAADPGSGLDSAASWAVRPFAAPSLFDGARQTVLRLASEGGRYGILPSQDWPDEDPWTAPTAWSAWSLAALANRSRRLGGGRTARRDRAAALALMADLRRAATPLGLLPERVDARTGAPRSTTPLAWSHAFAILAIRELWPRRG